MRGRAADDPAVEWLLRFQEGPLDENERTTFETWLSGDGNARAFARAQRTWNAVDLLREDPAIAAERARILRRTGAARNWRPVAAAAAVVSVLCAGLAFSLGSLWQPRPDVPELASGAVGEIIGTRVGERSSITLADGSVLTLNTNSSVRIAYTATERRIVLERGQAYFEVAKQQPQPFTVYAGSHRVIATGTAFDVRLDPLRAQVTLLEGEVHVSATDASAGSDIVLRPGQKLVARAGMRPIVSAVDLDQATSWTSGRLIFRDASLRDAVDEINRYSDKKIELGDPTIGALPVSGVFFTGQPARFARALIDIHPLTLRETKSGHALILSRRN